MKIKIPEPFTFEGGERAVLLLHGFTGNSADVRILGRYLQKNGYTCHAPHLKGHGVPPEDILKYGPEDWWEDVMAAYNHLKDMGHDQIAVAGLSLGGVFSLKLGYTVPIKGIIPMCAPMYFRSEERMASGYLQYAKKFKGHEGKDEAQIEKEMEELKNRPMNFIKDIHDLIAEVRSQIDMIYAPTFVVQARQDNMINPDSANAIYEEVEADRKEIKWYEESGHVITIDKEKDQLNEDIYQFLESLDW